MEDRIVHLNVGDIIQWAVLARVAPHLSQFVNVGAAFKSNCAQRTRKEKFIIFSTLNNSG